MKLELFDKEASSIWQKATSRSAPEQLRFELDMYKKLLSFFQVGDYYYWIFNLQNHELDLVSKEVEALLGYRRLEYTLQFLFDKIHPEDRSWFLNFENKAVKFLAQLPVEKLMKYKIRYDYRLKKSNGDYIRILHQTIMIEHDANGGALRTLGVHTDITHLKPEGTPVLSFIGLDGEPSYINVDVEKVFAATKEFLSNREKQVLALLIEGKLSKEIGDILSISKQTVDKHRKNMIAKNNLRNTAELISNAIKKGWI